MCLIGGDGSRGRYDHGPGGKPRPPIKPQRVTCYNRGSKCFLKYVTCPVQCPQVQPKDGKSKGCFLDCYSPKCEAVCRASTVRPAVMKAVVITTPGDPQVLQVQEVENPEIGDNEVLIRVEASALNRADTLQRKGLHPPPKGSSPYPGLECSGIIEAVGKAVVRWKVGDQVCALLAGGGYAEKVSVPAGQVLPVPSGVSLKDAAAIPEVACTVWSTVFMMSRLTAGETFLVNFRSLLSSGNEEKLAVCKDLGADVCINYKTEDFVARVKEETGGKGVDVILDNIGGAYFQRNIDSLNVDGRLFIIGFQGGTVAEVNLSGLLARRLTVQAAGLRNRSLENKAAIVSEVEKNVWPAIAAGKVKPVVYKYFPLTEAAEAHQLMESSNHVGKILLIP
ncbi:uncharacterized protein LOC100257380 [Vitis vinifera]|uniref:uncharacterized protein LOC100257380 n=1 Tax=Vitis vinifera TaxID=29760 RepID=UPI002883515D|nr:uncharacterized protein LOC100257380 [Vitis vinifera]